MARTTMNLPAGWATGSVSVGDVELQYYRAGEGEPIVFAHGFLDTGRRWIPLADELAEDYEVVAYDARGHGRSDAPETGYHLTDRIADLRGVVDGLSLDNPVLVGHSLGATTVGWTAARHRALPKGVVLVDPDCLHSLPTESPEDLFEESRSYLAETFDHSVEELIEESYEEVQPTHARRLATGHLECDWAIAELAREGYPAPLKDAFQDIAAPTLVMRPDSAVEERVADLNAAASLQSGRLVHIPDAGHYVFRDAFESAYSELQTFLRRL
jgi:pimeloyl-ACP methyl ester carboxylesterase